MSFFGFTRSFMSVKGQQAVEDAIKAMVRFDPEAASLADLKEMERELDKAGRFLAELKNEMAQESKEYEATKKNYQQLMSAAEHIQANIAGGAGDQPSLEASLENLLKQIEEIVPDLDQSKKDIEQTQELLTEAEAAYQEKTQALAHAKANLDRARRNLQHANLQEERARRRTETARELAGLAPTSAAGGVDVALKGMQKSAAEARQRAAAAEMKTKALGSVKAADTSDPNIAAALAAVKAQETPPQSLSERLDALRR